MNHIYIGKFDGETKYKQKQYLLWPLREIVSIFNGIDEVNESFEAKFNKNLTFSQVNDFFKSHKYYVYNTDIPHVSCLCEICENSSLLVRGMNKQKKFKENLPNNPHDLVERFSCNSDDAECMLEKCISC